MLFNEPKLLKSRVGASARWTPSGFSALQRAEIAEMALAIVPEALAEGFSALQRAEIAEIALDEPATERRVRFQCSSTSRNC